MLPEDNAVILALPRFLHYINGDQLSKYQPHVILDRLKVTQQLPIVTSVINSTLVALKTALTLFLLKIAIV